MTSTTPSNQQSAAQTVFDLYELSEIIILALPPQDLLLAPAVTKTWCTIFTTSKAIRNRLCFTPLVEWQSFPGGTVPHDCVVDIMCREASYMFRRLNEAEVIIILPAKPAYSYQGVDKPIVIDGKNATLKLTRMPPIAWYDGRPKCRWEFEFREAGSHWRRMIRWDDICKDGHRYLDHYHAGTEGESAGGL